MRFCIVGSGRCGTSLLRRLLDSHPDVFVHRETHWFPKMYEYAGLGKCSPEELIYILLNTTHADGSPTVPLERFQVEKLFRSKAKITVGEFCDAIGIFMAGRENKPIWGDKTPDYGFFMQQIQSVWPDCKFLHLIRNGVAVAQSMSKHPGYEWVVTANEATWCSVSFNKYYSVLSAEEHPVSRYVSRWHHAVNRIRDESTRIYQANYVEVFYEDIISNPKAILSEIAKFIDIDTKQNWLNKMDGLIDKAKVDFHYEKEILGTLKVNEIKLLEQLGYLN